MEKHCPTCGRSSSDALFIGEFCEDCIANRMRARIPDSVTVRACKVCGRVWSAGDFAEGKGAMAVAVRQALGLKDCTIKVGRLGDDDAELRFTCDIDGGIVSFTKTLEIRRQYESCRQCSRKSAGYYEAVVQLRGEQGKVSTMLAALERHMARRGAFISKIRELREGFDIYVSDKKAAAEFFSLRKLKPKTSYTLYGMKRGKKLYRNIYSMRLGP